MSKRAAQVRRERGTKSSRPALLTRLQRLLYEFEELGLREKAKPHILWLMELAKDAESRRVKAKPKN